MIMDFPIELREKINLKLKDYPLSSLQKSFSGLHSLYKERNNESLDTLTDIERLIYLSIRMPATFAVCVRIFEIIKNEYPNFAPLSLLDLGGGPGTVALAATLSLNKTPHITVVERDSKFIKLGQELTTGFNSKLSNMRWINGKLEELGNEISTDLVTASYSLGELSEEDQTTTVRSAWQSTTDYLLIIEPGTMLGFKTILRARDEIIKLGGNIIAPCPHKESCPMNLNPKAKTSHAKWCHFTVRLKRDSLSKNIKSGDLGYEDEPFSFILASKKTTTPSFSARITSYPKKMKGFLSVEGCGDSGEMVQIKIMKRDKEKYRGALKKSWGDSL